MQLYPNFFILIHNHSTFETIHIFDRVYGVERNVEEFEFLEPEQPGHQLVEVALLEAAIDHLENFHLRERSKYSQEGIQFVVQAAAGKVKVSKASHLGKEGDVNGSQLGAREI